MNRNAKASIRLLFGSFVLFSLSVTGLATADAFNIDEIEIEENSSMAMLAVDVPPQGMYEPTHLTSRHELILTFRGVSVTTPKRVHTGGDESLLRSIDVEPWFADGDRETRMVVRYSDNATTEYAQEGDVFVVTVAPGATTPNATAPKSVIESLPSEAFTQAAMASTTGSAAKDAETETAQNETPADAAPELPADVVEAARSVLEDAPQRDITPTTPTMDEEAFEATVDRIDESVLYDDTESGTETWDADAEDMDAAAEFATETDADTDTDTDTDMQPPADTPTDEDEWQVTEPDTVWETETPAPATTTTGTEPMPAPSAWEPTPAPTPATTSIPAPAPTPATTNSASYASVYDTQPDMPAKMDMDAPPEISVDLQGADIHTVLRSISESSGRNIVANAQVKGDVSLKLDDVPWRRALEIILKTQGLSYIEEMGIIRVAPAEVLRSEDIERETAARKREELIPLETRVVGVQFATASELLESVTGILSNRGKVDVDTRTNSLILTDIPPTLNRAQTLVTRLDSRTPQVEIVAKLVDIDVSEMRELGIQWNLDNLHSTAEAISGNAGVTTPIANSAGTVNFGVIRDFADLDAVLQMLETNQKANIISNPKITTVNNREARILVGQEIPLIVQDEAGNAITELKKIGIELRVTPYINQGDLVTLDLHPEVSDLASQSTTSGVIINTSEADTRVMVTNGETAVIGGLIRANRTSLKTGIPVLHRLPIIGGLFGSSSNNDTKRELVIFVTPRIVD